MTWFWNLPSFSVQFDPIQCCKFRTTSLLIQAPGKTNDGEHSPQLSVNCVHIVLCFLLLPIQCRCTLTWRWSCLWNAQVYTVDLSSDFESFRGGPMLWFLGIFPTRTPSAFRRFISSKWLFSEHHFILLFQVAIGSSPILPTHKAQSRRRRRLWRWWSDEPFHTISLSTST